MPDLQLIADTVYLDGLPVADLRPVDATTRDRLDRALNNGENPRNRLQNRIQRLSQTATAARAQNRELIRALEYLLGRRINLDREVARDVAEEARHLADSRQEGR